jgi:hypothetical protein
LNKYTEQELLDSAFGDHIIESKLDTGPIRIADIEVPNPKATGIFDETIIKEAVIIPMQTSSGKMKSVEIKVSDDFITRFKQLKSKPQPVGGVGEKEVKAKKPAEAKPAERSAKVKPLLKPIGEGRTKVSKLALGVRQKAQEAIKEQVQQDKQAQKESINRFGDNQAIVNQMKAFVRMSGEKTSKETGELFREHIPVSVFGQSSDEVADSLGMSESDFMAMLEEEPTIDRTSIKDSVEDRLNLTIKDLPEFKQVNMKDQAEKASLLIATNYEQAKRIARGEEAPPADLLPESVFVAVEDKALVDDDIELIRQLAVSGRVTEASAMGQRIRALAERDPDSMMSAINEVTKARAEAVKRKTKKGTSGAIKEETAKIKKEVKKISKYDWGNFISSIQC